MSDLVEHNRTGLLLDLNRLAASASIDKSAGVTTDSSEIPADAHALLDQHSSTFPLAVDMYRGLLSDMAVRHEHRRAMASAAYLVASKRSWFGAMEQLVDGYRELSELRQARKQQGVEQDPLTLSRVPTVELDVVCDSAAPGEAATSATPTPERRRLLRLNGVLRRTGGRLRPKSVNLPPIRSWLRSEAPSPAGAVLSEEPGRSVTSKCGRACWASTCFSGAELTSPPTVRLAELLFFVVLLYLAVMYAPGFDYLSDLLTA